MTTEEVLGMATLARRLGTTSRRILVHAARMTETNQNDAHANLIELRRIGVHHSQAVDSCCNLLLTPVASFATTALADAFASIRQDRFQAQP